MQAAETIQMIAKLGEPTESLQVRQGKACRLAARHGPTARLCGLAAARLLKHTTVD